MLSHATFKKKKQSIYNSAMQPFLKRNKVCITLPCYLLKKETKHI